MAVESSRERKKKKIFSEVDRHQNNQDEIIEINSIKDSLKVI